MDDPRPVAEDHRRAVLDRYRAERDKRIRADGIDQYVELTGRFAAMAEDPHVERVEREPLRREVTALFVGAGFAGLTTGARLVEAGIDVLLVEKGGGVGGTWYWNRYPGAQCDTHSFVYLPLLEETGHVSTEKYAHGPEILEHCERIAEHYGLAERSLFHTVVTDIAWDGDARRYLVRTDRGDELAARHVILGTGPLHKPKLPGIPGIETFAGHAFHTSRWDWGHTGGDRFGAPMTGLADQRVAVIGTGATAVQCVPHLARDAAALSVFQRTPSSIDVRANEPTDLDWFEREVQAPGWQERWLTNFTLVQTGGWAEEDLVHDGWTDIARRIRDKVVERAAAGEAVDADLLARAFGDSDFEKMEEIRARVDQVVTDPDTAEALKAWYPQLCKRPCFHDEYLEAFNRPTVRLVDTGGRGVERITERGVVANGEEFEVDCIVFASGFEVGTDHARRAGFDVTGPEGRRLSEAWDEGMVSLHGMHVHGFPNLYVVGAAQAANLISNYPHNLAEAAKTVAAILTHAEAEGIVEVEATAEAQDAWMELVLQRQGLIGGGAADCTPGYYNNEGHDAGLRGRRGAASYPDGPVAFFRYIAEWRTDGRFDGLDLRR